MLFCISWHDNLHAVFVSITPSSLPVSYILYTDFEVLIHVILPEYVMKRKARFMVDELGSQVVYTVQNLQVTSYDI